MRSIALLTTSVGILLHALLGWCPQHVGCAPGEQAATREARQTHRHCQGHCHDAFAQQAAPHSGDNQQPQRSPPHCCDHADCLYLSSVESVQPVVTQNVFEYLPQLADHSFYAVELTEYREQSLLLIPPCFQGQSARIALGVWLI